MAAELEKEKEEIARRYECKARDKSEQFLYTIICIILFFDIVMQFQHILSGISAVINDTNNLVLHIQQGLVCGLVIIFTAVLIMLGIGIKDLMADETYRCYLLCLFAILILLADILNTYAINIVITSFVLLILLVGEWEYFNGDGKKIHVQFFKIIIEIIVAIFVLSVLLAFIFKVTVFVCSL